MIAPAPGERVGSGVCVVCRVCVDIHKKSYKVHSESKSEKTGKKNIDKKEKTTLRFDVVTVQGGVSGLLISSAHKGKKENTSKLETLGKEPNINVHTEDEENWP